MTAVLTAAAAVPAPVLALGAPEIGRWSIRPAPDSRPPLIALPSRPDPPPSEPTLFDQPPAPAGPPPARCRLVPLPGGVDPDPALPDPVEWARTLTPALLEVLGRRRPLSQLARWLDDPVLGTLTVVLRLRQRAGTPPPGRAVVHTLRVQCPTSTTVEVCAHVRLSHRSAALAYRLEPMGIRWLCTALDLGDAALLGALPRTRGPSGPAATARSVPA